MGNFLLGFKALFRTLGDAKFAGNVRDLLAGKAAPAAPAPQPGPPPPPRELTQRNDALSLLSVLQREARFIDFIKEQIDGYSDAEVGAAVRVLHQESAAVLERLFALEPLSPQPDGSEIEAPAGFDPALYRFTGNIPARPPFCGRLVHPGWKAGRYEVPAWKGTEESAFVVAPTEVEF